MTPDKHKGNHYVYIHLRRNYCLISCRPDCGATNDTDLVTASVSEAVST